jgi:pyridoxamine 5'-phosphate oxidase
MSGLDFDHPPADPLPAINLWLQDAVRQTTLRNPNAMALATAGSDGGPSVRTVLLKGIDERGAVFFTNRKSRKGRALEANQRAALVFYWDALDRQLNIEGRVTLASDEESDAYFAARPRGAQVAAWASRQSEPVGSRAELDALAVAVERRYQGRPVPRPPHWGGYRVSLDRVEFWQGHPDRLHDRLVYAPDQGGRWKAQRLCP